MLQEDRDRINSASLTNVSQLRPPAWYQDFLQDKSKYYTSFYIPKTDLRKMMVAGYIPSYPRNRIPADNMHLWRNISAPVQCLRDFQKEIMHALYRRRPSKFDYCVAGKNRYGAIGRLAGYSVVIAADIKQAFPSTSTSMVREALRLERFSPREVDLISNIGTLNGCLPQGSPCSPVLLNLCRKRMDYRLNGFVEKKYEGVTSVYVDNYYFASNHKDFNRCIKVLKNIAVQCRYEFPDKKIYVMRKGGQQGGLGLVASLVDGRTIVQPDKKYRKRLQAILKNGMNRKLAGSVPWIDLIPEQVRGMVECFNGSIYYPRFRDQIDRIQGMDKVVDTTSG